MVRTTAIRMSDASQTAEVRRLTHDQVKSLGWSEVDSSKAALVATEIATNLLKHAQQGVFILNAGSGAEAKSSLQIVGVDHGPGMADIARCLDDGYSTAGSPGTGLGAIKRMTSLLDIFTTPAKGTVLLAEVKPGMSAVQAQVADDAGLSVSGVCVPHAGETENGDAWDFSRNGDRLAVLACDGLGHGGSAAAAAQQALLAFRADPPTDAKQTLTRVHEALRSTRGAAAAVAVIDLRAGTLTYCGVGNISGVIVRSGATQHLVSHNGILGHNAGRIAEFVYPWAAGNTLVMHSDGIGGRWRPDEWPGLWVRTPAVIAGTIYRDWERGRDDATVVVAKDGS